MPDETGSDYGDILLRELLDRLHEADQTLKTDRHAAIKNSLMLVLMAIIKASHRMAGNSVPLVVPGIALQQLLTAFDDLERGIVDPVLQPRSGASNTLPTSTRLARVVPAVAMQLIYNAGRKWEDAAKEVAQILGENHRIFAGSPGVRWRIIARWRTDVMSGDDPDAKRKFDEYLESMADFLSAREGTAKDLEKIARLIMRELDHYG
jgi:hypothetical protein